MHAFVYIFLRFYDLRSYSAVKAGVGHWGRGRRIAMRHHTPDAHRLCQYGALVQGFRWNTPLQVTIILCSLNVNVLAYFRYSEYAGINVIAF